MSKIEKLAFELACPIAAQIGCEVVETEFKKEGGSYFLRVYIDREDGSVGIDDCEYVSKRFSDAIDSIDPISEPYYLEVCSPGLDRKLKRDKDFLRFCGHEVDVKLYAPQDSIGAKEFCGTLTDYADGIATIEVDGKPIKIDKKDAVWIKPAVKF